MNPRLLYKEAVQLTHIALQYNENKQYSEAVLRWQNAINLLLQIPISSRTARDVMLLESSYGHMGKSYKLAGKLDKAIASLQNALSLIPVARNLGCASTQHREVHKDFADGMYMRAIGDCYAELGDKEHAIKCYKDAIQFFEQYAMLESKSKQFKSEHVKASEKLAALSPPALPPTLPYSFATNSNNVFNAGRLTKLQPPAIPAPIPGRR